MMFWTNEPLEGVAFDVQDHARRTGTRGSVHMGRWSVRTSMGLKNPPDGRWDGRGRTDVWWAHAQRRRRSPSSGCLWHRFVGNSPWQVDVDHDGQDVTSDDWTFSRARGSFDLLVWHVWHDVGGPGGATFHLFGDYLAQRGLTSHLRGLTSCLFAHFCNLACKKW